MLSMSYDEKNNYESSLSCLAVLKLFHDAGVDVTTFSNFIVDHSIGSSPEEEIFEAGCKKLFSEVTYFSLYDNDPKHKVILNSYKQSGHIKYEPESSYEIYDERLTRLLNSKYKEDVTELIKNHCTDIYEYVACFDGEVFLLNEKLVIALYSGFEFIGLTEALTTVHSELDRMNLSLKDETNEVNSRNR